MSAFEARTDHAIADHYDRVDRYDDFMESMTRRLGADDDTLADGMSDALYDPRTRTQVLQLVRSGDLLAAMTIIRDHAQTTYIIEQAEVAALKEFR